MSRSRGRDGARRDGPSERGIGGEQVEGRNAVGELLRAGTRPVHGLWLVPSRGPDGSDDLASLASRAGIPVRTVGAEELAAVARTDAPQGVVARAAPIRAVDVDALLEPRDAFLVALDGVTDPGNLGAVLRAAETAGVTGAVLPRHRNARLTPAAMKAAAGAVEHLRFASVAGIPAFLERARRAGVWSVGLDARGDVDVHANQLGPPIVVVLGSEGRGLSRLVRERCDVIARIPMHGRTESLNVAAAAAVACHAIARHR